MKFTKLIASLAAITTAVSAIAPAIMTTSSVRADSEENMAAYEWLYDIEATTKATFDQFAFESNVTREQAAKFLSVAAVELGLDSDSDQECDYNDLDSADASLTDYIVDACDMGLFLAQANFNPKAPFLRNQAELVIARMLYGMDAVNDYAMDNDMTEFAAAKEMLMDAGVVTVDVNGQSQVKRGHLALMLYRLADTEIDPTPCTVGVDCPVSVTGDTGQQVVEVKNGSLELSLNGSTLANNTQIPSTGTVRFAVVNFTAGNADVSVRSVKIAKMGLATMPSTTRIWFEKNGIRVSGKAAFTSEGDALVSFAPSLVVKAGATETLDLYVELATVAGYDLQFQSTVVDSSAQSTNGGFTTPTLRTVNYSVIATTINMASTGTTISATNNGMELGAFTVAVNNSSSETRNATFKSITLRQNGNADLVNLGNIILERNGSVVSTNASINGRDLTFSVNDTILDGVTATYYVKAVVNDVDQTVDTYNFSVRNTSDINIVEATTAFRTTVNFTASVFGVYSVNGGDITFTRTSSSLATSVAPGTTNVTLMQGTMRSNGIVNVENPTIDYATSLMTDSGAYLKFSTIYLTIGGSTFSYSPVANGTATGAAFLGSATINGTVPVRMYGTLKTTAPAGSIKFDSLRLDSFELIEYSNGNAVTTAVGSIEGINLTVESSTLNVTRTDGKGSQIIAKGTSDFTVLKMGLTSNQGNGVRVSRAQFDITASGSYTNNIDLSLYINGSTTPAATKTITSNEVTFDGFNTLINATAPATFEIKANFREAYSGGAFQITLPNDGLMAIDAMTSSPVAYSSVDSSTFTIGTADATVSASNDPILSQLLLSPSADKALMTFKIQALNDTINIKDLNFTGTNLNKLSNFRLVNSGTVVATATTATSGVVTFGNLATNATSIAKDQTVIYTVIANVNSNTTGTVSLHLNSAVVRGTNGVEVTPTTFTAVHSSTHAISENTLIVAKAANPSKSLTTSALRFNVTAGGKDFVTLTGIAMTNATVGYTTGTVVVYKGDMDHFAGSGAVGDSVIAITDNGIVDAGTTATYYIAIEGALINSTARDRSVSLNNVYFDGFAGASYKNVGTFSITEVK